MKERVLVLGASGHLGRAILREAERQGRAVTAVVRAASAAGMAHSHVVSDVMDPTAVRGLCEGYDVVISALGKSVSLNDRSRPSFIDVDLEANTRVLQEAVRSGVKKFIYVSAFHAERYAHLRYFHAHHEFEERLQGSGLGFGIVRPTALFTAYIDLLAMARRGRLVTIGSGNARTDPVHPDDVARVCLDHITGPDAVIDIGGPEVFTRAEINALIQRYAAPERRVRSLPPMLVQLGLPLLKWTDRNTYDKYAFFLAVVRSDLLAPQLGTRRFTDYLGQLMG